MGEGKIPELNSKIGTLIEGLGFTSSMFADHIEVSRPIISHIIAGRNKPSLDIIQRILLKFPALGINWTFDGELLDVKMLKEIASKRVDDSLGIVTEGEPERELTQNSLPHLKGKPRAFETPTKVIVLNTNESFEQFSSTKVISADIGNKKISKIVVFFDDNSFTDYNPA